MLVIPFSLPINKKKYSNKTLYEVHSIIINTHLQGTIQHRKALGTWSIVMCFYGSFPFVIDFYEIYQKLNVIALKLIQCNHHH